MRLEMNAADGAAYVSNSQRTRCITEKWAATQLYCASCSNDALATEPCNTRAADFSCAKCGARYQLKAFQRWNEHRIPDAGYAAMIDAIRTDRTPNLLVMQYSQVWHVANLLLVPSFFFTEAAVQQRKPLAPTARRAGWVGCNILLSEIASTGKILLVANNNITPPARVREQYEALRPLKILKPSVRGWTLDVLQAVGSLARKRFTLSQLYELESQLAQRHPDNFNVRPKIRQQLQVLRDVGLIRFLGKGHYEIC